MVVRGSLFAKIPLGVLFAKTTPYDPDLLACGPEGCKFRVERVGILDLVFLSVWVF